MSKKPKHNREKDNVAAMCSAEAQQEEERKEEKLGSWYWPGRKKGCHSDTKVGEDAAQQ